MALAKSMAELQTNTGNDCAVTVGIPIYKGTNPEHFKMAIDSILQQTLQPTVIHLIQDGPISVELEQVVAQYVISFDYIEHIKISENRGLPYALNFSILLCKTPYYARMDADDIAMPERLECQLKFLEENKSISILGTWAYEFEGDLEKKQHFFLRKVPTDQKGIQRFFHYRNPFIHPSVMFRREVFARLGLYNTSFKSSQDTNLWARALKAKIQMANIPKALLFYRANQQAENRSDFGSVCRIARAHFSYNTFSLPLNLLKIMTIIFRVLPKSVKKFGYKYLRS